MPLNFRFVAGLSIGIVGEPSALVINDVTQKSTGATHSLVHLALFKSRSVDLSDLAAVDRVVTDLSRRGTRLDRLILNAAIVPTSARTTPQGLDEMFVVNYLSSFALATRLLEAGVVPGDRPGPDVPTSGERGRPCGKRAQGPPTRS